MVGDDLQIDLAAGGDLHEVGLIGDVAELEAVARRIGDQAAHRQQFGHVAAGFGRQFQVPEIGRMPSR